MAPAGQGALWSEVLCCPICSQLFSGDKPPVNLSCGHTVCRVCLFALPSPSCPIDQTPVTVHYGGLPVNWALLSIVGIRRIDKHRLGDYDEAFLRIEAILIKMSSYLRKADSERGGSVWSDELSRPVQRKLLALLCLQLVEEDGRQRALKTARALAERILSELVIAHQNSSHISSNLWSAVRARGCQFLGPAMQEEVLRLILLTLSEGALIARKTLVMYIVQTLAEDYPQVSKTCVGHVVQLLYRASCFNGESSLMQLKTEFRDYESLRREHDAQIVQVALEAGLRISPDQWSSLLYGDQSHRSHMQSIIDKLQSPQAFGQLVQELLSALQRSNDPDGLLSIITHFKRIASFDPVLTEPPGWSETVTIFESLSHILDAYVHFNRRRNEQRSVNNCMGNSRRYANGERSIDRRYKTRLCRDTEAGRTCPRGARCTYAHSQEELRQSASPRMGDAPRMNGIAAPSSAVSRLPNVPALNPLPMPNSTVPVISMRVPPPPNPNAVVVDPRQQINAANDAGGSIIPLPMPMVPVVIPGGRTVDANVPNTAIPLPPNQIPNARVDHAESITPNGAVVMMAPGNPQTVMMPAVWPTAVSHTQTLPAAVLPPTNVPPVIPMPLPPPPPPQMPVNPNAVAWMQNCGNGSLLNDAAGMQFNVPFECFDAHWRLLDDQPCCAVSITPVTTVDAIRQVNAVNASLYKRQSKGLDSEDEEQLMMRRREIISRLADLHQKGHGTVMGEDTIDEDDLQSHVSYTVASSVLYDEKETNTSNALQLPPLPLRFNATPIDDNLNHLGEVTAMSTTIPTVCPPCIWTNGAKPATVQAPCTIMQVKDTINQPLPTPAIQRPHMPPLAAYQMQDPSCIAERLPPVIRPLPVTPCDPQNVVSATLDRIVDVRERMNDVEKNGGMGCSVEKQQLRVELNIVSRQIQSLDQQTKQSCLLRELEAVDKKIEHLNVHC